MPRATTDTLPEDVALVMAGRVREIIGGFKNPREEAEVLKALTFNARRFYRDVGFMHALNMYKAGRAVAQHIKGTSELGRLMAISSLPTVRGDGSCLIVASHAGGALPPRYLYLAHVPSDSASPDFDGEPDFYRYEHVETRAAEAEEDVDG